MDAEVADDHVELAKLHDTLVEIAGRDPGEYLWRNQPDPPPVFPVVRGT